MDDFYRIPKSKCYMMLTRPKIGSKGTLEKASIKALGSVVSVEKPHDDKTTRVSTSADEIVTVKLEYPEDEKTNVPDRRNRRQRGLDKKRRDRKPSKRKASLARQFASRSIEKTGIPAIAESCRNERDDSDMDDVPLEDRKIERRDADDNANDEPDETEQIIGVSEYSTAPEVPRLSDTTRATDKPKKGLPYECEPCGYKFSRKWKYERHMNTHARKRREPISLECAPCGRKFTRPSAYKQHMLKHSNEKPHKCIDCDKAFKRPYELKMHREIHSGSMHTCDICSFSTAYKVSLMVHKKRVHQKIYRHKCDQCEKAFMSKHELEDHRTCHLGEKSFICEICGNGFLQRSYLVHHKRVVHGVHNRAPMELKCDMCDKTFATKYCLQNHMGIHSQKFLCSQCGKEFATNYSLRMHNRMHTGERPHKCNMCSKSFARSNALAVHKLTHTGQRPYVCDICDKTFTQRTTMMSHRRKHPGTHPPPPRTSLVELANAGDSNS